MCKDMETLPTPDAHPHLFGGYEAHSKHSPNVPCALPDYLAIRLGKSYRVPISESGRGDVNSSSLFPFQVDPEVYKLKWLSHKFHEACIPVSQSGRDLQWNEQENQLWHMQATEITVCCSTSHYLS